MNVRHRTSVRLLVLVLVGLAAYTYQSRRKASPAPAQPPAAEVSRPRLQPPAPTMREVGDARRRDLQADEERGGHTIARHVGRTPDQLRQRLDAERGISAASSYTDLATAERVVAAALEQNAARVEAWLGGTGRRPNLALDYRGREGEAIGSVMRRRGRTPVVAFDAVVVLRWIAGREYYVLTSYPEARR